MNPATNNPQTAHNATSTSDLPSRAGLLMALKTTLEISARESTVSVFIAVVHPPQKAKVALKLAAALIPNDGGLDLHHLSRFAKYSELPPSTQSHLAAQNPPSILLEPAAKYFIVGPTRALTLQVLTDALADVLDDVLVQKISVPLLPPTSQEQAESWTKKYWRVTYNKNHSFGPHPHLLSVAEEEIRGEVATWMGIARRVARQARSSGRGEGVGVCVVERRVGVARVLAAAGDARWHQWPEGVGSGNVTAHAVMRAIGMVAEGLRVKDETTNPSQPSSDLAEDSIFQDAPLGDLEKEFYRPSEGNDGYLCHNLEIYCTHEPCVMCSMAIVHSRFGRIVFAKKMHKTGGICAEGELGHGLFWRKELNWTMYGWHWEEEGGGVDEGFEGNA